MFLPAPLQLVQFAATAEMGTHGVFPATGNLFDGQQFQFREAIGILGFHGVVVNTVVEACQQALGVFGIEVLQVLLGQLGGAILFNVVVNPRHREFSQEAYLRRDSHVFTVLETVCNVQNLRLEGQQDIANAALNECGGGTTTAAVKNAYLTEQVRHELINFFS